MFTGIIQALLPVVALERKPGLTRFAVQFESAGLEGLQLGASVSVDGVCQTVVKIEDDKVWFEAIQETLDRTTLKSLLAGRKVNVERSIRLGDEIGGHLLSGHVFGTAEIKKVVKTQNNHVVTILVPKEWIKYLFPKGFVALDGASLTIGEVQDTGKFTVHLIPETLSRTTFGFKREGDRLNIEFDSQTQTIVDTVERIMRVKRQSRFE